MVYTVAELQAQLASVDAAITTLQTGGQSVTIGAISYTLGNLSQLDARRDQIIKALERAMHGRPVFRRFGFRNSAYNKGASEPDVKCYNITAP